jgi:molybdate transport system substrate-binding protein
VTVLAAASLTETFGTLATTFESEHPGVHVRLAFGSSATLAGQVVQGAPADVLATADRRTMDTATRAGATAEPAASFATNSLVLVVPRANPAHIQGIQGLAGSTYVACVESAPCGALARTLLAANHVTTRPSSLEVDVKAVLNKVALDEADAGLVYGTDARAADGKVRALPIPGSSRAVTSYLIAPLVQSRQPRLAHEWTRFVLSARGQHVLARAGFGPPS